MATEHTTSYNVAFQFSPVGECGVEHLETTVVDVLDALDEHTSEAVTGAAATVVYDPPGLEVSIGVDATTLSELHRVLAEVMQVLEDHAGLSQLAGKSFAETAQPNGDREPVAA